MKICGLSIALVLLIGPFSAHADDLRSKYVGTSSCAKELWGPTGNYGIRLDRTQNAYLAAHTVRGINILMIVQYAKEGDECGVIKDVVASKEARNHFEFVCVDCRAPSVVVVGACPEKNKSSSIGALEAWKVHLKNLEFVPITGRIKCLRQSYEGSDEGDDVATWARREIKKYCPNVPK